jgi:cytoskeletal protein CcmA (bactofilin family)
MWKRNKPAELGLFVPKGSVQNGDLCIEGRARIDGTFSGSLFSESKFDIGKTGIFEGEADVEAAEIAGKFNGNLRVRGKIHIMKSAVFHGKLDAQRAIIEEGSTIEGEIRIKPARRHE